MKKLLQLKTMLLLFALIAGSGSVWAVDVTFTFNTDEGISALGISKPSSSAGTNLSTSTPYTIDGVNMAVTNGGTSTRVWNSGGTLDLRIYKNGGSLTFTAPGNITKIVLTGSVVNKFSTTVGSFSDGTWEGDEASVKLTATDTGKINTITVTYTSSGEATTVTIDDSGIKSDRKGGTAAGTFSASVTAGGEIVDGAMVSWSSSEESVATIDEDGKLTLVAAGKTTITATYAGNATYASSTGTYNLTVTDSRTVAGLEFETTSQTINVGQMHGAFALSNPNSLTVSYSSDDTSVATVIASTGVVTGIAEGSTIIRATFEGNDDYKAGSASYTLTVHQNEAGETVGPNNTPARYVKVTSSEEITNGNYLIVYEDEGIAFNGGLETLDAGRNKITVTIANNSITATETNMAAEFTIDVTNGTLKSASGKYIGVSANTNGLGASDESTTYTNSFEIDEDENVIISAVFQGSTMSLRYNSTSGASNERFRYYKNNSQKAIQLYKYVEEISEPTFDVTIGSSAWRTIVTSANATLPLGLTAYIVTGNDGVSATLTPIDAIKANTAVLLKGEEGKYTLTVTDEDVNYSDTNLLEVSNDDTTSGVYVLANKDPKGVGFYLWDGGLLGAGRVYLPALESNDAREFISFDTTTGIEKIENAASNKENGVVFNLAGQRVAKPSKGLYIVNGRKVIVK